MTSLLSTVKSFVSDSFKGGAAYYEDLEEGLVGDLDEISRSPSPTVETVQKTAQEVLNPTKALKNYEYDTAENVLTIEVETPVGNGETKIKKLSFQITSLKVKEKGKDAVEVLGVRTDKAIQTIMHSIAENFAQIEDAKDLLRTEGQHKEEVKTFKFGYNEDQPTLSVEKSLYDREAERTREAPTEYAIQNPSVLNQLLKASNWTNLIKYVQSPDAKAEHKFNANCVSTYRVDAERLDQVTDAIFGMVKEDDQGIDDRLYRNLNGVAHEEDTPCIRSQLDKLNGVLDGENGPLAEKEKYQAAIKEVMEALPGMDHLPPAIELMQEQVRIIDQFINTVNAKIESLESSEKAILDILLFDATRQLEDQRQALGNVPFGGYLTQEWRPTFKRTQIIRS